MTLILRFLRMFTLGTWVGGIVYFATVVAPGAFAALASRDDAGAVVRVSLGGLHLLGLVAAMVFVIASLALEKSLIALVRPAALGVILMLALTIASQQYVMPRMATLRSAMGSVQATPTTNAQRGEFDRLHRVSELLEGGVLLIGLAALFLTLRDDRLAATKTKAPA
jgi:hypothetical protein